MSKHPVDAMSKHITYCYQQAATFLFTVQNKAEMQIKRNNLPHLLHACTHHPVQGSEASLASTHTCGCTAPSNTHQVGADHPVLQCAGTCQNNMCQPTLHEQAAAHPAAVCTHVSHHRCQPCANNKHTGQETGCRVSECHTSNQTPKSTATKHAAPPLYACCCCYTSFHPSCSTIEPNHCCVSTPSTAGNCTHSQTNSSPATQQATAAAASSLSSSRGWGSSGSTTGAVCHTDVDGLLLLACPLVSVVSAGGTRSLL